MEAASTPAPVLRQSRFADLTPAELYALIQLRVNIFVVEQQGIYPELDGRDVEPDVVHLWHDLGGEVVSVARMLTTSGPGGEVVGRIGRIGTAPAARCRGLAGELVRAAIDHFAPGPVVLAAQAHLEGYYGRFGFVATDEPRFEEHGIPHVPMRRG